MIIERHTSFLKAYKHRILPNPALVKRVNERIALFLDDPDNILLGNHQLRGNKLGLYAFSVTGDMRVIYVRIGNDRVRFLDIGTHNQVY